MTLRHAPGTDQQLELFSAMFTDIATRDSRDAMELPFLSLSKTPRFKPIIYETDDVEVTITGGEPFGIANIWDWDLMMWLVSQLRQALDAGSKASRKVRFHRHAFLKAVRRSQGGAQYRRLEESIARLKNTNVVTTVRAKGKRTVMFSWIEYAELERDTNGNVSSAIVVLPEWLFEAVTNESLILTLHPDYFLLTGGLERWLYRFIRKGAGWNRSGWRWPMPVLYARSGSAQGYKYFARDLRCITERGRLLDYELRLLLEEGITYVAAKRAKSERHVEVAAPSPRVNSLLLRTTTYERAKELARGHDVYALEADWKGACSKNRFQPEDPDAAFLGWCSKVARKRSA